MDDIELNATLKKATSKKGEIYYYLSVQITDNIEKKFFFEPAELELLKLTYDI